MVASGFEAVYRKKGRGAAEEPRPVRAVDPGSLSPGSRAARRRGAPRWKRQSLKLRITVGMSRSLPKSLDAIGPKPPEPSGRLNPFRKNGGS